MQQRAQRFFMNPLLRCRINRQPLYPYPPITLEATLPTFLPEPGSGHDLPHEHCDTRRNHDEEHHAHPRRDVAEHFARSVIDIRHRTWLRLGELIR